MKSFVYAYRHLMRNALIQQVVSGTTDYLTSFGPCHERRC